MHRIKNVTYSPYGHKWKKYMIHNGRLVKPAVKAPLFNRKYGLDPEKF